MEQLNKIVGPVIMQLAQQRRFSREQQDSGQEGVRLVDADPPVQPPSVDQTTASTRRLRPLPQLPPPTGVLPAPLPDSAPSCPHCKGYGYVRADVPYGHPHFGKPLECQCKRAKKHEEHRQRLREQSQLDALAAFQEESFETFQLWLPGVQEAYDAALHWASMPQGWLVLAGSNGCGKTHLAVAIAKRCLENGSTVLFAIVPDLLDRLRAAFAPTAEETYDEEFARMREVEVLILDDLGSEQSTGWAMEKLFQLLNYRYNARMATIITTNMVDLEGIAPRLRSRMRDRRLVRIVTLTGAQDFREMELGQ